VVTLESWYPLIAAYPVGKSVSVYYDAKHPEVAVLYSGLVDELKLLFKLAFILMATIAGFFSLLLFDYRRQRNA